MTRREQRALADALRALPLEDVAAALGYRRDPGDRARWKRDGSVLSITGERFFDHLRGVGGGGAIDLAIHARQCGFRDALRFLSGLGHAGHGTAAPVRERPAEPRLPPRVARSWPEVRDSLVRNRGLDPSALDDGHASGIVYADGRRNAVFVARDAAGRTTGAEIVGTRRAEGWPGFKGMAPGSRKARGAFWLAVRDGDPASALLVESAVDALSVLTQPPPGPGHDLVVSTAGVCTAVPQWLEAFDLTRIGCGFDADDAGDQAADALAHRDTRVWRLRPEGGANDWNDRIRKPEARPEPD